MDDLEQKQMASLKGRIKWLEEENDQLREQVRQAHAALTSDDDRFSTVCHKLHLSRQLEQMVRCLYKRNGLVTKEQLYVSMYAHRPDADWADQKIIDVQVCKIRAKIGKDMIDTVWGRGYTLTEKGREFLKNKLEEVQGGEGSSNTKVADARGQIVDTIAGSPQGYASSIREPGT